MNEVGRHLPSLHQGVSGTLIQSPGKMEEERTQAEGRTPRSRADLPNP